MSEEQRREAGCSAGRMPAEFHHGLLKAGLALIKFRYHVTYLNVMFGALLFAPRIDLSLALELALLYVSFNVLLYGGIYTFNDIVDREADARHPRKRYRPIAAGRISVCAGAGFAAVLIVAGLVTAFVLFDRAVAACFVVVLAFNVFYSVKARNVQYADVLFNSLTHPTRFLMGVLLVGRVPPVSHLVALLLLAIAMSCLRREVERDAPGWQARETIARYSPGELPALALFCLTALALLAVRQAAEAPGFYAALMTTAVVVAAGGWLNQPVRSSLRAIWTR